MRVKLTTQDVAAITICLALYVLLGFLISSWLPKFYGVSFFPAVIISAVFVVIYGSGVGGISGGLGMFMIDIFTRGYGISVQSLGVGVLGFMLFFIIGYIYTKNISLKRVLTGVVLAIVGLLISSFLFSDIVVFVSLSNKVAAFAFTLSVIVSLVIIATVAIRWKEWRNYVIGAIVGQIVGGLLLSVTVWTVSPLCLSYLGISFEGIYVMSFFVLTAVTETLLFLIVCPPIIKAIQISFPIICYRNKLLWKGGTIA